MNDPDRLARIEALVEKIGQRVDSNARAIEAISANTAEYQRVLKLLVQERKSTETNS